MPIPTYLQGMYLPVTRVCTGRMKFLTLPATPVQVIHAGQKNFKKLKHFRFSDPL